MLNTLPPHQTAEGIHSPKYWPYFTKIPIAKLPLNYVSIDLCEVVKHIAHIKQEFARRKKARKHEVTEVHEMRVPRSPLHRADTDNDSGPELPGSKHNEESSVTYRICWCLRPKWQVVSERHNLSWNKDQRETGPQVSQGRCDLFSWAATCSSQ